MKDLRLVNLRKTFAMKRRDDHPVVAVERVNLEVERGTLVTLLGPSGCGKTTLLRMLAGFEAPTEGDIYFGEDRVTDAPPNTRNAAMVFQSYAIFPHLSVFENIAFGLRLKHVAAAEIDARVTRVLEQVGLKAMAGRMPAQLSGGQQQRVALARCIVTEPRLLLFDEPLSNLDAKLREHMRGEIRALQRRIGITTVYVTHDQVEAMSIADLLVILRAGVVEQIGTPLEIYARPANRFVASFIGEANFVEAVAVDETHARIANALLSIRPTGCAPGQPVTLVLRPEALQLRADRGLFEGTVRSATFLGSVAEYEVAVPALTDALVVEQPNPAATPLLSPGTRVWVQPADGAISVIDSRG